MRAHTPSTREWFGDHAYDIAGMLGLPHQQRMRDTAVGVIDYMPGPGDAVAADETRRAINRGDYGDAAFWGAGTAMYAPVGKISVAAKKKAESVFDAIRSGLKK